MNKKIVIMLTALLCVVSVIIVSLMGQIPDFQTNVLVKEIIVDGYVDINGNTIPCEKNNVGDNVIWLDNIEAGETTIVLKWSINPDNATEPDVFFSTGLEDDSVVVSSQGIVTFYSADVQSVVITIKAKDGGLAQARVIIMKRVDEEVDGGDIDILNQQPADATKSIC